MRVYHKHIATALVCALTLCILVIPVHAYTGEAPYPATQPDTERHHTPDTEHYQAPESEHRHEPEPEPHTPEPESPHIPAPLDLSDFSLHFEPYNSPDSLAGIAPASASHPVSIPQLLASPMHVNAPQVTQHSAVINRIASGTYAFASVWSRQSGAGWMYTVLFHNGTLTATSHDTFVFYSGTGFSNWPSRLDVHQVQIITLPANQVGLYTRFTLASTPNVIFPPPPPPPVCTTCGCGQAPCRCPTCPPLPPPPPPPAGIHPPLAYRPSNPIYVPWNIDAIDDLARSIFGTVGILVPVGMAILGLILIIYIMVRIIRMYTSRSGG